MTATPRTDALHLAACIGAATVADLSALARTLERELSAKSAECQRFKEALEHISDKSYSSLCTEYAAQEMCDYARAVLARAALAQVTP